MTLKVISITAPKTFDETRTLVTTQIFPFLKKEIETVVPAILSKKGYAADRVSEFLYNVVQDVGFASKQSNWENRRHWSSATEEVVSKVAMEYLKPSDTILELGAGELRDNQQSYLVSLLPECFQSKVLSSDMDPIVYQHAVAKGFASRFLLLDGDQITSKFSPGSLNVVMGLCFLDTVLRKKIEKVMQEIKKVLQPGGLFIHLSDLPPLFEVMIDYFIEKDKLVFPYLFQGALGVQIVDLKDYQEKIRPNLKISKAELDILDWYAGLSNLEKGYVLQRIYENTANFVANWIEGIIPQSFRKVIPPKEFLYGYLKRVTKQSGLELLNLYYERSQSTTFSSTPIKDNLIYKDFGSERKYTCYVLAPNVVQRVQKMLVLIAQKTF